MAELLEELVKIEITKPLPEAGTVGVTYKIEGTVKMFDAIGAPPWVYAEVRRKEWWKPEFIEEVSYERGFPIPITGDFSIDIKPEKKSDYEVTVIATPAPLALPVVGVFPVVGKSDMVKIRVAEPTATDIKNIEISVIGPVFPGTDIKNITIRVIGVEFPSTDIKNIAISVLGPAFPATDIKNIKIALVAVPVEFKGTISKKELEYNESRGAIPAYNVPQDKEGKVHIWGRNDMVVNQKLGIHWIVKDPDGLIVEDYEDWESWPNTNPGKTHEFISPGRFDLNKPGSWTIATSLAMNPESPLTVASYSGVLCTVKAVVPTTYHLSVLVPSWAAGGSISPGSGDYPANSTVRLTATPFSGYQFTGWGRDASGTSPTYDLYMNSDKNVEAYFEKVPVPPEEYTLEVTVEPPATGHILVSPRKAVYSAGEVVTLTAYPYSGYEFDHWGGWPPYPSVGSTSRSIQITMTANWWVVAAFQKVTAPPAQCPLSVSASPSSGGSVTRSPYKSLYDDGEMIDVTAIPNPGWSFDKFTGDGWETRANPVHVRGCMTTSVTAHFIQ